MADRSRRSFLAGLLAALAGVSAPGHALAAVTGRPVVRTAATA